MVLDKQSFVRITSLIEELERFGLNVKVDIDEPLAKASNGNGLSKYWEEIHAIMKEKGCSTNEARQLYNASLKQESPSSVSDNFSKKMSDLKKEYWQNVAKIAAEKNISKVEARDLLKKDPSLAK